MGCTIDPPGGGRRPPASGAVCDIASLRQTAALVAIHTLEFGVYSAISTHTNQPRRFPFCSLRPLSAPSPCSSAPSLRRCSGALVWCRSQNQSVFLELFTQRRICPTVIKKKQQPQAYSFKSALQKLMSWYLRVFRLQQSHPVKSGLARNISVNVASVNQCNS